MIAPRAARQLGAITLMALLGIAAPVFGEFPERPITFVVPWDAGGTTDQMSRALAKAAEAHLGQPIIVLNKPGAYSVLGMTELASAKPDGYTVGALASGTVVIPFWRQLPFDPVKSFSFVHAIAYTLGGVAVHADSPWKTLTDLIEDGKAHPGKIKYGTSGVGSVHHITMESLAVKTGARFVHIPQKGAAGAMHALLGKQVDVIVTPSVWAPYVESNTVRLLAVMNQQRAAGFSQVPTLKEFQIDALQLFECVVGPAGIPEPIRKKLEGAFRRAQDHETFIRLAQRLHVQPADLGGRDVEQMMKAETERAKVLVEGTGLRPR